MIADTKKIERLLKSDLSAWGIQKKTGVSRNAIIEMRHGRRKIENLRLKTAIKLTDLADKVGEQNADS